MSTLGPISMLKILLPIDRSAASLDAVRHVMNLALHGLKVHVVLAHAEREASVYELVTSRDTDALAGAVQQAADDAFEPAEALLRGMHIPFERDLTLGDPARVVLEMCERHQCQLIVMGAQVKSDLASALFGSVSHTIANHAPVPVTLVHRAA